MTKKIEAFYDKNAALYDFMFIDLLRYGKGLEAFFRKLHLKPQVKILDAGCGSGLVTKALSKICKEKNLGCRFYGFDISQGMLNRFEKWIHKNKIHCTFEKADVLQLSPKTFNTHFDLIICSAMLEYVPKNQLKQALTNLKNVLGLDGRLFIFISRVCGGSFPF